MSNQSSNPKNTADNNESIDNALESLENTTKPTTNNESVDVEVVKGDTVIYEDGDFEEFNSENELDSDADEANSNKEASKQEESKQDEAKSKQDSDKKEEDSDKEDSEEKNSESDKHESAKELYSTAIANIYQWAAKLKDEFMSDKEKKSDSEQASDEEKTDSDKKEGASDKEGSDKEDKHSASIANLYKWAAKLKEDFASEAANMTHDVPEKALAIMLNKLLSGAETELKAFDKKVEQSEEPMGNAEEERSKLEAKKDKYQGMIDLLQGE